MQYYELQYIIKILLLNGLFVLFSHAMDTENSKFLSPFHGKSSLPSLFPELHLIPDSELQSVGPTTPLLSTYENNNVSSGTVSNYKICPSIDYIDCGDSVGHKAIYSGFNNTNNKLPSSLHKHSCSSPEQPLSRQIYQDPKRKRKRSFLQKSPSQEKKTKIQTPRGQELRNLQKPYVFKCEHCPDGTAGAKKSSMYRYRLIQFAKNHLRQKHQDLYPTEINYLKKPIDESIIKYLKKIIQYPKKVIQFSARCPNDNCRIALSVTDQPCGLAKKMFLHVKNHNKAISLEFIKKYVQEKRQYPLIPNPYIKQKST